MDLLQATLDGMSKHWQEERAETQMTLGALIKVLEEMPKEIEIIGLGGLDSYRGYYSDLAFEPSDNPRPVSEVLAECRAAMGEVFTGYKGGEFVMGAKTPLWVAAYGRCGERLMAINDDGTIITANHDI